MEHISKVIERMREAQSKSELSNFIGKLKREKAIEYIKAIEDHIKLRAKPSCPSSAVTASVQAAEIQYGLKFSKRFIYAMANRYSDIIDSAVVKPPYVVTTKRGKFGHAMIVDPTGKITNSWGTNFTGTAYIDRSYLRSIIRKSNREARLKMIKKLIHNEQ